MKRIDVWQGPSLETYGSILHSGQVKIGNRKQWHQLYLLERMLIILKPKNTSSVISNRSSSDSSNTKYKVAHKIALPYSKIHLIATNELSDEAYFRIMYLNSQDHMENVDCFALNKEIKKQWVDYLQNWTPENHYSQTKSKSLPPNLPSKDTNDFNELNYDDIFGKSTLRLKKAFSSLNPMEWKKKNNSNSIDSSQPSEVSLDGETSSMDQYFHNQKKQRDVLLANMTCNSLESIPETIEEEEEELQSIPCKEIPCKEIQRKESVQSSDLTVERVIFNTDKQLPTPPRSPFVNNDQDEFKNVNRLSILPTPRSDSLVPLVVFPQSPQPLNPIESNEATVTSNESNESIKSQESNESNQINASGIEKENTLDKLDSEINQEKLLPEVPEWIESVEYDILLKKYEKVSLEASELRMRLQDLTEQSEMMNGT